MPTRQLQAILQKQPTNAQGHCAAGRGASATGRLAGGRDAVSPRRRCQPAIVWKRVRTSRLCCAMKRAGLKPLPQYESCHKLAPRNFNIATELAAAYQKNGDFAKSLAVVKTIPPVNRTDRLLPVLRPTIWCAETRNTQRRQLPTFSAMPPPILRSSLRLPIL